MIRHRCLAAIATVAIAGASAHADDDKKDPLSTVFEGEVGFGVIYSTSDLVGFGLYTGFSLAKPVLGACYIEPLVMFHIDLTGSTRVTGLLRCNFNGSVGKVISLGVGAGFGHWATQDSNGNSVSNPMNFREVEIGYKIGGKHRFAIAFAMAFDETGMGGPETTYLIETMFVRAGP